MYAVESHILVRGFAAGSATHVFDALLSVGFRLTRALTNHERAGLSATADRQARAGVVGGGIRGSMFAPAISENPGARLVAVCDQRSRVLAGGATSFEVAPYGWVEARVGAHPELTAAIVALP